MFFFDKFKKESLRFKIPFLIPIVSCFSFLLALFVIYSDNEHDLEQTKNHELRAISEQITLDFTKIASKAQSRADMLATMPSIAKAFKKEDRDLLLSRLTPMFQEQKKNFDVIGVEFHKTPAITFLRLQNPDSYGDDVSDYRETVVSVNKLKSKQKGLELDKSGLAIRGVVPVFYDKEHIGSLEFMFSFMSILNKIKKNSGADISIFVSKKKYDDIFIETSNKNEKMEDKIIEEKNKKANTVDKFIFLESTNKEKIMSIVTSRYLNKGTVFYTVYPKVNGKEEGLAIEPLFDFSGAKIGAIVISKNFDKLNAQYKNKFKANVAIKLFQVLLVSIISVLIYNVWLMMPLYKMSTVLKNRLNGQHDTFDELTKKKNEIGSLARVLQKLCESSENALKDAKPKREDKKKKESDD